MDDELRDNQFTNKGKLPAICALQARRMKRAADVVFRAYLADLNEMQAERSTLDLENLELAGPGTLLYGLAFENIIKALIVKKKPEAVIADGKLKNLGHDLLKLAE